MKIWKRLLGVALCLCTVLCVIGVRADAAEAKHSHDNCGAADCTNANHGHSQVAEWIELTQANINDGTLTLEAGKSYYLGENITTTTKEIAVNGTVNLCLNGKTLERSGTVITVYGGGVLNICNCKDSGGEIANTSTSYNSNPAIQVTTWDKSQSVKTAATLNLYGGTISSRDSYNFSGTIELYNNERENSNVAATFNMYGGEVCNTGSDNAIYASNSNIGTGFFGINIYGGTVTCTAANRDGIYHDNNKNVNILLAGGKISAGGYAVNLHAGNTLILSGSAEIVGNHAGIYLPAGSSFTLQDGFSVPENGRISVMQALGTTNKGVIATPEGSESLAGKADYFVSAEEGYFVEYNSDGSLQLTACEITKQPTAENNYTVTANGSPDKLTYQWYRATKGDVPVTDAVVKSEGDLFYSSGWGDWSSRQLPATGEVTGFTLTMKKGDELTLDFSGSRVRIDSVTLSDGQRTITGTREFLPYTLTAPADGNYTLMISASEESMGGGSSYANLSFTAKVTADVPGDQLDGQVGTALNTVGLSDGSYICRVTWEGKTTLDTQAVTYTHQHIWSTDWTTDTDRHWHECQNTGCPVTEDSGKDGYAEHTGGTATCTAPAECATCHTAYGEKDSSNHTGTKQWTKQTETAHEQKWDCCDAVVVAEERHEWRDGVCSECSYQCPHTGAADDGDCTTAVTCSNCGKVLVAANPSHTWGAWTSNGDGTHTRRCTVEGYTAGAETADCSGGEATCTKKAVCDDCGESYGSALDHDWADATCTDPKTCKRDGCGVTEGDPLGHEWGRWVVTKPATEDAAGRESRVCRRDSSHIEIRRIPKLTPADDGCSMGSDCPLTGYGDLTPTAWYHDGVHYCIENGLMQGVSTTEFQPDGPATRAQLVTILWRLEGSPEAAGTFRFSDVADGAWYAQAVRWAAENGVVKGYDNGCFGPNGTVTREQMVTVLYRYAQYKGRDVSGGEGEDLQGFTDASSVSGYAEAAMRWACGTELMTGIAQDGGTALMPKDTTIRAQVATLILRFLK